MELSLVLWLKPSKINEEVSSFVWLVFRHFFNITYVYCLFLVRVFFLFLRVYFLVPEGLLRH